MRTINQIAIHHSGGLGNDNYASTLNLTVDHIDRAHKERWDFRSKLNYYAGYNAIYDPKTRKFTQTRLIGEETASIKGHNFNTFHLCIIGNYNKKQLGSPIGLVDPLTDNIKNDISKFIFDLLDSNSRNLVVENNIKLDFSVSRIYSHRFFSRTFCYGTGIKDNFFRDEVIKIKKIDSYEWTNDQEKGSEKDVEEKKKLIQTLIKLYSQLLDLLIRKRAQESYLGAVEDREEPENLPAEVVNYKF